MLLLIGLVVGFAVGYWHEPVFAWLRTTAWPWIRVNIFRRPV